MGLRVEGDGVGAVPGSGVPRPARRVAAPRALVDGAAGGEDLDVAAGVAGGRRDEADAAVLVLVVYQATNAATQVRAASTVTKPSRGNPRDTAHHSGESGIFTPAV